MGDLDGFKSNPLGPNKSQLAGRPSGNQSTHLTPFSEWRNLAKRLVMKISLTLTVIKVILHRPKLCEINPAFAGRRAKLERHFH